MWPWILLSPISMLVALGCAVDASQTRDKRSSDQDDFNSRLRAHKRAQAAATERLDEVETELEELKSQLAELSETLDRRDEQLQSLLVAIEELIAERDQLRGQLHV